MEQLDLIGAVLWACAAGAGILALLGGIFWVDNHLIQGPPRPIAFLDGFRRVTIRQLMLAIGVLAYLMATATARHPGWHLILGCAALLALFVRIWVREFAHLMTRPDAAFPGRSDKLIWALVLFLAAPVGVWMYREFRRLHSPEPAAEMPEREAGTEPA